MTKRLKRDPFAYIKNAGAKLEPKVMPKMESKLEPKVIPKLEPELEPKFIPKLVPYLEPGQLKERINNNSAVYKMERRTYYLSMADIVRIDEMAAAAKVSKNVIISVAVRLLFDELKA